jgi:hypothetical protein
MPNAVADASPIQTPEPSRSALRDGVELRRAVMNGSVPGLRGVV